MKRARSSFDSLPLSGVWPWALAAPKHSKTTPAPAVARNIGQLRAETACTLGGPAWKTHDSLLRVFGRGQLLVQPDHVADFRISLLAGSLVTIAVGFLAVVPEGDEVLALRLEQPGRFRDASDR